MSNQKRQKQQLKRQLINEHLPYEVYALATMRYYAILQDLGMIDVVEVIMHIEDMDEDTAIGRCMDMLKDRDEPSEFCGELCRSLRDESH